MTTDSWYIYTKKSDFNAIARKYGVDPVIARILRNRDITSEKDLDYFFRAGIDDLYDETLIPDLVNAADIVWDAVRKARKIRIVGDYDIDGVSATYILFTALRELGANADYRIPDRIKDGYGVNMRLIDEAFSDGVELILTCDNGISAIEEMERAKELGIVAVITDHHDVRKNSDGSDLLPDAPAVVDVKRSISEYPTKEICGAVTAWKLIKQVFRLANKPDDCWLKYLEFAAIATVGDIMELKGENRIIVREGLKALNRGALNPGLRTLIAELGLAGRTLSAYHIGFVIGPAINAAGRLESAESAIRLFLTDDAGEAGRLAGHLKSLNDERKSMTEAGVSQGISIVEGDGTCDSVLVVYIRGLHESLAGIVAGRLKEHYSRPCFVITDAKEGLKGSGRSIEKYNMFEALSEADSLLSRYGGHKMAAGLSLKNENLTKLRSFLNSRSDLKEEDFIRKIWIDTAMPLSYVSERLIREIDDLAPFGQGFSKPIFADRNLRAARPRVLGNARNALRFTLIDEESREFDAIMFGEADRLLEELMSKDRLSVLYFPGINSFRGSNNIQFHIEDFR